MVGQFYMNCCCFPPHFGITLSGVYKSATKILPWWGYYEIDGYRSTPIKKYKTRTIEYSGTISCSDDGKTASWTQGHQTSQSWNASVIDVNSTTKKAIVYTGSDSITASDSADGGCSQSTTINYSSSGEKSYTTTGDGYCPSCDFTMDGFSTFSRTATTEIETQRYTAGHSSGSWITTTTLTEEIPQPTQAEAVAACVAAFPPYLNWDGSGGIWGHFGEGQGLISARSVTPDIVAYADYRTQGDEARTAFVRRVKYRLSFNPPPLNYLKVWLRKITTPDVGSATHEDITVEWTGTPADSDKGNFDGIIHKEEGGTELMEPDVNGTCEIGILKYSFQADYEPNLDADPPEPNGFR